MKLYDLILIDDDELVRLTWSVWSQEHNKRLGVASDLTEFVRQFSEIDRQVPIYIDLHLGYGVSGYDVGEKLHQSGFTQLYLTTGWAPSDLKKPTWLRGIIDKMPPSA